MRFTRRDWLRLSVMGLTGHSLSGWLPSLAADAAPLAGRTRSVILLWMPGGPSQTDTFDMKPGHANGGEFKPIDTSVPGIQICEHLPQLARQMQHVAVVPSMQTREGDHLRATYHLHTGYLPQPPVQYPTMGSLFSHELANDSLELPGFVSITPNQFFNQGLGAGFLGPSRAPLVVGGGNMPGAAPPSGKYGPPLTVRDIALPDGIVPPQAAGRIDLLNGMEESFAGSRPALATHSHREAYRQAVRMMHSPAIQAFDLEAEPEALRDRYGRNRFGQSCLLARRLVEQGVPFIEIGLSSVDGQQQKVFGWDTHGANFPAVKAFCDVLDPGWATLVDDLHQRGLLESTLIIWMGEFGRTPQINNNAGRDHYPNAWTTVLCGGGIRGGQRHGKTSQGGEQVDEHPVSVPQLFATICRSLGIDSEKQNMSNVGRPIRIVEPGTKPIEELLA